MKLIGFRQRRRQGRSGIRGGTTESRLKPLPALDAGLGHDDETGTVVADNDVEFFAGSHRDRIGKCVQHLQPSAIGIVIRVIGKRDPLGKIDVHPLDDTNRDTVVQHRDRECAGFREMFFGGKIDSEKIHIAGKTPPRVMVPCTGRR